MQSLLQAQLNANRMKELNGSMAQTDSQFDDLLNQVLLNELESSNQGNLDILDLSNLSPGFLILLFHLFSKMIHHHLHRVIFKISFKRWRGNMVYQ